MNDDLRGCQCTIVAVALMSFVIFGLTALLLLSSCTIAVTTIHSQGVSSDLMDQTQGTSPEIQTDLNLELPVKAI